MAVVSGAAGALLDSLLRGTHQRTADDLEIINSILSEGRARAHDSCRCARLCAGS